MNYKNIAIVLVIITLSACNRTPEACFESFSTQVQLGEIYSLYDGCSKNRVTSIVDWGDQTSDTLYKNKKGATFSHQYQSTGVYWVNLKVYNKIGELDVATAFVSVSESQ